MSNETTKKIGGIFNKNKEYLGLQQKAERLNDIRAQLKKSASINNAIDSLKLIKLFNLSVVDLIQLAIDQEYEIKTLKMNYDNVCLEISKLKAELEKEKKNKSSITVVPKKDIEDDGIKHSPLDDEKNIEITHPDYPIVPIPTYIPTYIPINTPGTNDYPMPDWKPNITCNVSDINYK